MSGTDDNSDEARQPRRGWSIQRYVDRIGLTIVGVGLPWMALSAVEGLTHTLTKTEHDLVLIASAFVSLFLIVTIWKKTDPSWYSVDIGRERVRAAERGLEEALRVSVNEGTPIFTGSRDELTEDGPLGPPPEQAVQREPAGPQTARPLALPELWALTHRRLDLYHDIATKQAKRSFRNAQIAMGIGFALLAAFVAVALNASTTAGAVVSGGLGAVSAALAGFVSRTFVRSQETAAGHLKAYFDQPLEFSRYLAAERLIADAGLSDEQKAAAVVALVQAIVAGPGSNTPTESGSGQPGGTA
ncbi:hypothetical protein ACFV42_40705 [Streptomyces solisilvae]|uniref:TRADD-N-associated membrane domain-containing protein n=1 Tax=Streptomyces malaysiensis TaxID=92644 RepID=UPI0036AD215F